jgi:hypothetical protein
MLLAIAAVFGVLLNGCSSDSSSPANPIVEDQSPPAAPLDLNARASESQITVAWEENSETDFSHYLLYRKVGNETEFAPVQTCSRARFLDTPYEGLFTYQYRVTAVDQNGNESPYSAIVEVVIDNTLPLVKEQETDFPVGQGGDDIVH